MRNLQKHNATPLSAKKKKPSELLDLDSENPFAYTPNKAIIDAELVDIPVGKEEFKPKDEEKFSKKKAPEETKSRKRKAMEDDESTIAKKYKH
jgi:hypothetical protein